MHIDILIVAYYGKEVNNKKNGRELFEFSAIIYKLIFSGMPRFARRGIIAKR